MGQCGGRERSRCRGRRSRRCRRGRGGGCRQYSARWKGGRFRRGEESVGDLSAEQGGSPRCSCENEGEDEPLPAQPHARLARAIEHHGARRLNGADSGASNDQCRRCKQKHEDDDYGVRAHKPEDYNACICCGNFDGLTGYAALQGFIPHNTVFTPAVKGYAPAI